MIRHLVLLLTVLFTVYLCYACYFSLISVYILSSYAHMLNTRAPSPLFYTLIGSLSDDPEFARPDWMLYSILGVRRDQTCCEEVESLSS